MKSPLGGDDLKIPLYEDVSETPMIGMLDPFSAGTLTFVRTIETFVESVFSTVPERFTVADHFFSFGEDG
jgi:hypothetical protein